MNNESDYIKPYMMPDGSYTTDTDKYYSSWMEIAEKFLACCLPGWKCAGFNPTFEFTKWEKDIYGNANVTDRLSISAEAINTILEATSKGKSDA